MIDLNIVGQNFLTLIILGFLGWIIYQKMQGAKGHDILSNIREKFGKFTSVKSKLRK